MGRNTPTKKNTDEFLRLSLRFLVATFNRTGVDTLKSHSTPETQNGACLNCGYSWNEL